MRDWLACIAIVRVLGWTARRDAGELWRIASKSERAMLVAHLRSFAFDRLRYVRIFHRRRQRFEEARRRYEHASNSMARDPTVQVDQKMLADDEMQIVSSRVIVHDRWSNAVYRTWSGLRSIAMFVKLWRLAGWHDRMMLLNDWEELSPDERQQFCLLAGNRLRRQLAVFRTALDAKELEISYPFGTYELQRDPDETDEEYEARKALFRRRPRGSE